MKAAFILGTRAELIKTFPIMKEILNRGHDLKFIHTGQHNLKNYCDLFQVPEPDVVLSEEPEKSSKFQGSILNALKWNFNLLGSMKREIKDYQPDYVLYHGDTMTTALASLAGSKLLYPFRNHKNVHIEAGLRSGSIFEPFPEEISRKIADLFSDILFTVSPASEKNLKLHKMLGKNVYDVGNSIVDSATRSVDLGKDFPYENYGVVTVHRYENITSKKKMEKVVEILLNSPRKLIFPVHDNTKKYLKKFDLWDKLKGSERIEITELMEYPNFISLLSKADIVYTDGGSIQEEVLIFKLPCIILKNRSPRKMALKSGLIFTSEFKVEETIEKAKEMAGKDFEDFENPYGEPGVSQEIVNLLEQNLTD